MQQTFVRRQPTPRRVALALAVGLAACAALAGAPVEELDLKEELPRIPPREKEEALATFTTLPGFRIEQIAAEPMVHSPVAVAYDEMARAYVVEMIDYSEQDKEYLGAVRLLEDRDGDGRYDASTLFAEKLSWPTAIACYDGGVFVGAAPDIVYMKDTDGDGRADIRKVVFTGFGRSNVQGLFNSFQWGLDHRIHGAVSSSGGQVRRADQPDAPVHNLNGRDFSFDPRTLDLAAESGGAQHGMCFDDWGRKFVCSNSDHIQLVLYEDRYAARNPRLAAPGPRESIAADGPQAEVFRTSPVEPWRVVRTRLRVQGVVPGPVEGGGRPAGYFTGATGVTIYRGDAWPSEFKGEAFIGDVGSNIVHRKRLEPSGVSLVARRADAMREFVASTDTWFRPAQFANAPDGTLHIIDVYREVIEHPASLPPVIKRHLDLTSGRDRGRLYRVVPENFQPRPVERLGSHTPAQWVRALEHPNAWHRETAARLLYERQDPSSVLPLRALARDSASPLGRMHALYALAGQGALDPEVLLPGLADSDARVRRHAVRLSEPLAGSSPELRARLRAMTADEDLLVRYQLAFTLGELPGPETARALAQLLETNGADRWVRLAVQSSLAEGAADVAAGLLANQAFLARAHARETLGALALQVGLHARGDDVGRLLGAIDQVAPRDQPLASALVAALIDGLTQAGSPLRSQVSREPGTAQRLLAELLQQARGAALDEARPIAERAAAARSLALGEFEEQRDLLEQLLQARQPQELQLAAIAALGRFEEDQAGAQILSAWPGFGPRLRSSASEVIFSRPVWLAEFLEAVARGDLPASDLEPGRLRLLEQHKDQRVAGLVGRLKQKLKLGQRDEVLAAYQAALKLKGNAEAGKKHFQKICAACHRLQNVGHEIGPNLATLQNRGPESILLNVLDPNREVNPQYVNYVVMTTQGRSVTGMIAAETATSVTLRRKENETDTILRSQIEEIRGTGLSIMPEGLEKELDQQAMADLIAYLMSLN